MEIIPVIDLLNGLVVHARKGRRECYQPIRTLLCQDAEPCAVIDALLSLYPFRTLYIADLDALMHRDTHGTLIDGLTQTYPELTFWIDQGLSDATVDAPSEAPFDVTGVFPKQKNRVRVIGSESLDFEAVPRLARVQQSYVLSLDYSAGLLLGPQNLLARTDVWPETVIVMNLARVGTDAGPDLLQLERFIHQYPEKNFVAAGGVRDEQDLVQLDCLGVSAALVASALHNRRLHAGVVSRFNGNACSTRPATVTPHTPG